MLSVDHKRPVDKKGCTPLRAEDPLATHEAALRPRLTAHLRGEETTSPNRTGDTARGMPCWVSGCDFVLTTYAYERKCTQKKI